MPETARCRRGVARNGSGLRLNLWDGDSKDARISRGTGANSVERRAGEGRASRNQRRVAGRFCEEKAGRDFASVHQALPRPSRNVHHVVFSAGMKCNHGAEVTVLSVGRFACSVVGHVPELPIGFVAGKSQNASQGLRKIQTSGPFRASNLTSSRQCFRPARSHTRSWRWQKQGREPRPGFRRATTCCSQQSFDNRLCSGIKQKKSMRQHCPTQNAGAQRAQWR